MKTAAAQSLWTDPNLAVSKDFYRMSYALYRTDGEVGRVIAARVPDRQVLRMGDYLQDQLGLSDEAVGYMTAHYDAREPLLVMTKQGFGLLSHRYQLSAGLGLFLHVHTRPDSAARLVNHGVLGYGGAYEVSQRVKAYGDRVAAKDESAYPALAEAWQAVQSSPETLFPTDTEASLRISDLYAGIRKLAAFVGCDLRFTIRKPEPNQSPFPDARVKCYRPRLLEGILFTLLSEIRESSATRGGVCRLELPTEHRGDGLSLSLRYPAYPVRSTPEQAFLEATHSHLSYVGDLGGLDVYFHPDPLPPRATDGLPERGITLEWLLNPAVLSTSDLKAFLRLDRGDTPRPFPSDQEIPYP